MRKWVVAGLVALVVLVGGCTYTYLLSRPRKGSVEYHKREYLAATKGTSLSARIDRLVARVRGKGRVGGFSIEAFHLGALIDLGYLERRVFVVSNSALDLVEALNVREPQLTNVTWDFIGAVYGGTNHVWVIAPREEMPEWEKLIRKFDVKEKSNVLP